MGCLKWPHAFSTSELLSLSLGIWALQTQEDKQSRLSQRPSAFRQRPSSSAGTKRQPHSSSADCDSDKTRAQASPCWKPICALARPRRRRPTDAATTPNISGDYQYRHYRRRQVRANLRRPCRSKGWRRKAVQTTQQVLVSEIDFEIDLSDREEEITIVRPDDDNDKMRPSTSTFLPTSTETKVSAHGHSSRDRRLSTTTRPGGTTSTTTRVSTSQYRATSACGTSTELSKQVERAD